MAETLAPQPAAAAPKGLLARAIGIPTAPRATYASVSARPRALGALLLILTIAATATLVFLKTEVGQQAALDQQIQQAQAFGRQMTADQQAQMERFLPYFGYIGAASQVVSITLISLLIAGVALAVFNAMLGGDATFKHVFAVVVHSGFIITLQQLFVLPLDYVRESLTSPTNLAVFLPFLEDNTFAGRLLGSIDLFLMWWAVSLAIGLGVLYKRRTGPIAAGILIIYFVLALVIAAVRTALAGV